MRLIHAKILCRSVSLVSTADTPTERICVCCVCSPWQHSHWIVSKQVPYLLLFVGIQSFRGTELGPARGSLRVDLGILFRGIHVVDRSLAFDENGIAIATIAIVIAAVFGL